MALLDILEQLRDFDTALLANTIGYIDPTPAHEWYMRGSVRSLTPSLAPTVGVAFTCELDSSTPVGERGADEYAEKGLDFYDQLDAIAGAGLPVVRVVRAVGSRPDHECILGDGMAKELPFAVYAPGTTNHHCPLASAPSIVRSRWAGSRSVRAT